MLLIFDNLDCAALVALRDEKVGQGFVAEDFSVLWNIVDESYDILDVLRSLACRLASHRCEHDGAISKNRFLHLI